MEARTPSRPAVVGLLIAAAVLAVLSAITYPFREDIYRAVAEGAEDLGGPVATVIEFFADPALLVLVATAGGVAIFAWIKGTDRFLVLVWAGIGTVLAYLTSEGIKSIVEEERPCRTYDVVTLESCPDVGDWSWPSNHSAIAGAFATACILVVPRLWPYVAPWALLIGLSRIGVGAHYMHDVAAGLAWGIAVTLGVTLLLDALVRRARFGERIHTHARPGA